MSNAFGQDDTASGGLQTDMPEIGAAPPSPRYSPPSPLNAFAQSIFGRQGAPRSAQPGPSPFQFPGRSQIPQGPQGQPNQRRWTGTTASLALPRGSPQPPLNFSPYQKSLPIREPNQWGTMDQFSPLPAAFEVPSVLQGVSQFFGQNGSALAIPLALSMGKNAGAFIDGMMKGEEFRAKMARERAKDAADKLQAQQEAEQHAYGDIAAEYAVVDPSMATPIKGVGVREAFAQQAYKLGDDKMAALIESGAPIAKLIWFQQQRDANLHDLQKANKKTDEQDFSDKLWSTDQGGGGDKAAPAGGGTISTGSIAGDGVEVAGGGSFAEQLARQGAPAPRAPVTASGEPVARTANENDQLLDTTAVGLLENRKIDKEEMGPHQQMIAFKRAQRMQHAMDEMLKDQSLRNNPEGIKARLAREVSPSVAQQFEGALNYDVNLGQNWGTRTDPLKTSIQDLAEWARPPGPDGTGGWNAGNYAAQLRFKEDSQTQQTQLRVETTVSSGQQLVEALHNAPDAINDPNAWHRFSKLAPGQWAGEDWAIGVQNAWMNYNMEKNTLIRAGGGSVTLTEESRAIVPTWLGSRSAYMTAVAQDAGNAVERVMATQNRYRGIDGKGMFPGFNKAAFQDLIKLANTEPSHELQPGARNPDHPELRWNGVYDDDGNKIPESKRWTLVKQQ